MNQAICTICKREYTYKSRHGLRVGKCGSCSVAEHRRSIKRRLVAEFGGKCVVCGYDRCVQALDFHHLDPKTKSFGLASRGVTHSYANMLEEAKKCVLICRNCHGEHHAGLLDLTMLGTVVVTDDAVNIEAAGSNPVPAA